MSDVCARCPRLLGSSCCEASAPGGLATLTWADVDRIRAHVGVAAARFVSEEWLSEDDAADYAHRRPLFEGYFRHGPRRLTLRMRAGACVFLDRVHGCRLPAEVRPIACRLYPFDRWADGSWGALVERHGSEAAARAAKDACLAVETSHDAESLLRALGTTAEDIEQLGEQMRRQVVDHARRSAPGAGPGAA